MFAAILNCCIVTIPTVIPSIIPTPIPTIPTTFPWLIAILGAPFGL